jgi:hypothetical protein
VEERSRDHLETARYHQRFAQSLLDPTLTPRLPDGKYEWATVMAFYAAVHYVHAYLWERHRYNPRSHAARAQRVRHDSVLRQCEPAYSRLLSASMSARYERLYQIHETRARGFVEVDLAQVEAVVTAAI